MSESWVDTVELPSKLSLPGEDRVWFIDASFGLIFAAVKPMPNWLSGRSRSRTGVLEEKIAGLRSARYEGISYRADAGGCR